MNRIVRENYPVSKLPEDLQKEFPGQDEVTLTIEGIGISSERVKSLEELFALAEPSFSSLEEVAAHVRSLRGEWD